MALTINAKSYVADGFDRDSVHYQGPAHTGIVQDTLVQKRYAPKASDVYSGNKRFLVKAQRSHALTGARSATGVGSAEIMFSLPVGISDADRDSYCNDLGAYIASAAFKASLKSEQVNG